MADRKARLILASKSEIRARLLHNAGLDATILPASVDEQALKISHKNLTPAALADKLAAAKASEISTTHCQALVIGADQTLSLKGRLFNKPENIAEVRENLKSLRGQTHSLHTALSIAQAGKIIWRYQDQADLVMREFSDDFLEYYLKQCGDGVLTSLGGYQLEGHGAQLFAKITGDYFSILGLPLLPLLEFLRQSGKTQT